MYYKEHKCVAFTRSVGDKEAEGFGVIAEPELSSHDITEKDAFIVIASDGNPDHNPNRNAETL